MLRHAIKFFSLLAIVALCSIGSVQQAHAVNCNTAGSGVTILTTTGAQTCTGVAGWNNANNKIEAISGAGDGFAGTTQDAGGGGGGACYSVVANATIIIGSNAYQVGIHGGVATTTGASSFGSPILVSCRGAGGGGSRVGGTGAVCSGSTGTCTAGANGGGTPTSTAGGGGGAGSSGPNGASTTPANSTASIGANGTQGGNSHGGAAGNGGSFSANCTAGGAGTDITSSGGGAGSGGGGGGGGPTVSHAPGCSGGNYGAGGGGGGGTSTTGGAKGNGAQGVIVLTNTATASTTKSQILGIY